MRAKQFDRGLSQLEQEGAVQVLWERDGRRSAPVLGAVGELQFDVVRRRLADEYGVETVLDRLPHSALRIASGAVDRVRWPSDALRLADRDERTFVLFRSDWDVNEFSGRVPEVELEKLG